MPQEKNLPINEPTLLGVGQPVTVDDPTGSIGLSDEPEDMQRRLWVLYPLASLSISAVSGGVNGALLAKLIAGFSGANEASQAAVLGLALSISGITYLLAAPIGGLLSDRTRTRFLGRRNLWVLIGAVAGAIALIALGSSPSIPALVVLAAVATIPVGVVLAATSAVIPERVPIRSRGRISSINSLMALVGAGLGIAVTSLAPTVFIGFVELAIQLVVFCALFAFFTRDEPAPVKEVVYENGAVVKAKHMFPTPKSHPDYWWTFAARGLAFMAYGLATGLQLYSLRDYFGAGSTHDASLVLAQIIPFSTIALAVAAILGGLAVDRFGRLKPFVIASSLLFIPAALVLALVPSIPGAFIGFILTGLAFGSYISVDGVLMTRVIPSKTHAGRDLGILNVSGSVGSIIAPALAGGLVAATGYGLVFFLVIAAGALASGCVVFIRSVR
ncbi:MFS transporter [Curtobacterium sp. VKM Ac-2887]|uniref:MFS transporter n=1 Tax=Curtobacterium sp. VKM Ac-2887 TaxID=2783819 RepID=UPI001889DCE2|nr:MFS transporter [Curtobacterium sp. VKM Ac-2887]MBF4585688.1 MFS transporter [Curtobacterium sp. VKM Ac-2887]